MTTPWSADELKRIDRAAELHIAAYRSDGTPGRGVPVWAVVVGGSTYVRTWHRRDTGWFGRAVRSRRARVSTADLDMVVSIDDVGKTDPQLRGQVDAAYRRKYGRHGQASVDRMVDDDAAAATLRLNRDSTPSNGSR